jgi:hypothetical protein
MYCLRVLYIIYIQLSLVTAWFVHCAPLSLLILIYRLCTDLRVCEGTEDPECLSAPPLPQYQYLQCDEELWHTVVTLCCWESVVFVLKVVLLPLQLYSMIGGPLLMLFIWPLWAVVNSVIFAGVFWAREPATDPCLSTAAQWLQFRVRVREQTQAQEGPSASASAFPLDVSEVDGCEGEGEGEGEGVRGAELERQAQSEGHTYPLETAMFTISRARMAGILAMWSVVDILLSLLSAISSFLFVFLTFSDADGGIAEGWVEGYVLMFLSGVCCLLSIVLRVAIVVYCFRFRYRVAARAAVEVEASGPGSSRVAFAPKTPVSLKRNTLRFVFFLFSIASLVTGILFCSLSLHDFLRSQYYLPSSVQSSLHGDASDERCDPMDPLLCMLPFPSSHYLQSSVSTATGYSVDITDDMLPMLKKGKRYDSSFIRVHDGFSVSSLLLWYLSPHVNSDQLVSYNYINDSLLINSSTTLLINSQSWELHPHFSEKDYIDTESDKLSYLAPAKALQYDTTYIAVVKGLTDSSGQLLPPAAVLQDYLQDYRLNLTAADKSRVARDAKRYTYYSLEVFPRLEEMGVQLSEVQLLWDLHTASQSSLLHNLAPMYNLTTSLVQEKIQNKEKLYKKISSTSEKCTGTVFSSKTRSVHYTLSVPWYLHDHSRLINPLDGYTVHSSPAEARQQIPFAHSAKLLLQIPCSVSEGLIPASALMEIGHGLFWDRSFAEMAALTEQANQNGWVMWSMDWRGMTRHDLPQFMRMLLHDMSETSNSTLSAMAQGMSDKLAGYLILQVILEEEYKDILKDSAFFLPNNASSFTPSEGLPNHSLIPPTELRYSHSSIMVPNMYLGMSLGAIMGAAWNAYAPIHLRSVLIAGGSVFTFILGRSDIFGLFKSFTDLQFYSRKDLRLGVQLVQLELDTCEASGWAHSGRYQRRLQPGQQAGVDAVPSILLQTGIGDSTVTAIAGRILAANLNASLLSPSVHPRGDLPAIAAPVTNEHRGNVLFQVLYADDSAVLPTTSESGDRTDVHKCIIQREEITSQYSAFYNDNRVIQPVCEQSVGDADSACVFEDHIACDFGI